MTRVYLADGQPMARSALRRLMGTMDMEVVGEADDWQTVFAYAPSTSPDLLIIDWELIPTAHEPTIADLRQACPSTLVIVLISDLDARQQAARSAGADIFISKGETSARVVQRLLAAAGTVPPDRLAP